MRLGVLGGTFDPVHLGHLVAAVNARHCLSLDRVLLVVANQPWQKAALAGMTPAEDRYAMVAAAVDDVEGLEPCHLEIGRGGLSYTADTLAELGAVHPGAELFLVVGADQAASLRTWERVDEVVALSELVVVSRPGAASPATGLGWRAVHEVEIPGLDISSTDLRRRAAEGLPLDFLVPCATITYIRRHSLYSVPR